VPASGLAMAFGALQKAVLGNFGIIVTILAGFAGTVELVLAKVLKEQGLPYFRMMSVSALLTAFVFAAAGGARAKLTMQQATWMILRAFFGTSYFVTSILALQAGALPGDVAALTSINIVLAALLGRWLLQERLRGAHLLAIASSIAGAVLISRPEFLFGASADRSDSSWVGCVLALASGFLLSGVFICARKSTSIPVTALSSCTALVGSAMFFVLPLLGVSDESFEDLLASPGQVLSFIGVLFLAIVSGIGLDTAGSVMCPAAVSASIRTASAMGFGYAAEVLLFHTPLQPLTIVGAALMLVAVVTMATTRVIPQAADCEAETGAPVAAEIATAGDVVTRLPTLDDDYSEA